MLLRLQVEMLVYKEAQVIMFILMLILLIRAVTVNQHRIVDGSHLMDAPNETVESKDNEGNVHQIHRWTDEKQKPHETDNWTDSHNNVHQCHRWVDEVETIHEAVQVTKCDGSIVSEHFTKDRYGAIRRIDPVPLGQYGNSGDYRQNVEHSVDAFSLP